MAGRKRKAPEPSEGRPLKRKADVVEEPAAEAVHHPSHGKVAGRVFVWGDGDCGQLGLGEDVTDRLRPWPVDLGVEVLQVACGGMHTVALDAEGAVWTWGVNDEGALGRPTAGESAKKLWEAANAGDLPVEDAYRPARVRMPEGAARIVQVSAGDSHTCALAEDGTLWAWGTFRDSSGVMGFSPDVRTQVSPAAVFGPEAGMPHRAAKISSGDDHVVAITVAGRVFSWGNGQQGQLGRVGERIPENRRLSAFLTPAEILVLKRPSKGLRVVDVQCKSFSTFVSLSDGRVYACGLNNYGQLGLKKEGCIFAPVKVPELQGCSLIRPGQHHTLAVRDNMLYALGRTTYGRLGRADVDATADAAVHELGAVAGLEECAPVAGAAGGLAVSGCFGGPEGRLWLWGMGGPLQGNGDEEDDCLTPQRVKESKKFNGWKCLMLEFGGQHACMLGVRREGYVVPEGAE